MPGPDVLVVGAGVSGLTTAVRLLEAGANVLVRTAAAPIGTASAVAGAMIGPDPGDPTDPAGHWLAASDKVFRGLAADGLAGVSIRRGRLLLAPVLRAELPPWAAAVPGFRALTVRLEREGKVVHNYGHGGNGVMLSWGCADAAAALAFQ